MSIFWAISAGLFAASAAVAVAWWWLEVRRPESARLRRERMADLAQATPLVAPVVRRSSPRPGLGYSPPVDPESTADFPSPS